MGWKVPLFDLDLGEAEREAVCSVIDSGWLTQGPKTEEFETAFAAYLGTSNAVAVSSGTAALHLACLAAGLGPGDEAIVPSLSFVATANAVVYTGAHPVFADVTSKADPTVSPRDIERRITARTKAVIVMHYAGYACDMRHIAALARERGLIVIEDAAHALGASLGGKNLGTLGNLAAFSSFSNKNITTGEGGMVVTDDADAAALVARLRSHGITETTWDRHRGHAFSYDVLGLGFNYRTTEMASALGLTQLARLGEFSRARRALVERYREALALLEGIELCFPTLRGTPSYHLVPAVLHEHVSREIFVREMCDYGVQTSMHYPPIHEFRFYRALHQETDGLPQTESVGSSEVTLPLFPSMTDSQFNTVIEATAAALKTAGVASSRRRRSE